MAPETVPDGFFSAAPVNIANTNDADGFAQAIAARFGAPSANQLTARLDSPALSATTTSPDMSISPPPVRTSPPAAAPSPPSTAPLPPAAFTALHPNDLAPITADPDTLILDIRPHAAYTQARLRSALSLSVPSTLLKRPLFSLARLTAMLPSASARRNFRKWKDKRRVVVYDLDSPAVREGSNLLGLMRKFANEGMAPADVCWVAGGFQALWRENRDLIDQSPLADEHDEDEDEDDDDDAVLTQPTPPTLSAGLGGPGMKLALPGARSSASSQSMPVLRTKHLPMSAFTLSTTTSSRSPRPTLATTSPPASAHPSALARRPAGTQPYNPFFDTIRQNIELSHGITERIPLVLPRSVRKRVRRGDLAVRIAEGVGWEWLEAIAWRAKSGGTPSSLSSDEDEKMQLHGAGKSDEDREREKWTASREGSRGLGHTDTDTDDDAAGGASDRTELSDEDSPKPDPKRASPAASHPSTTSASAQSSTPHSKSNKQGRGKYHLPKPTLADVDEGTEELAMQFYKIELAEQRRLMGVMEHHSREGAFADASHASVVLTPGSEGQHSPLGVEGRKGIGGADDGEVVKERDFAGGLISSQEVRKRYTEGRNRAGSVEGSTGSGATSLSATSGSGSGSGSGGAVPPSSGESSLVGSASASVRDLGVSVGGSTTAVSSGEEGGKGGVVPQELASVEWRVGRSSSVAGSEAGSVGSGKGRKGKKKNVFPFSITAGVEKGAKNRYRNIWPFEHARVKLHSKPNSFNPASVARSVSSASSAPSGACVGGVGLIREPKSPSSPASTSTLDDYVNASYVQPLGTRKRYIATQGPLEATFADFWTLCWEQNVHVIVMLTKEVEGMMEKSGKYWREGQFGPLVLRVLESSGTPEDENKAFGFFGGASNKSGEGGFFGAANPRANEGEFFPPVKPEEAKAEKEVTGQGQGEGKAKVTMVKRVFELRNVKYPDAGARIVTQLQYLDWPDMNVPDDPNGVLDLVEMMNAEVEKALQVERAKEPERRASREREEQEEKRAWGHAKTASTGSTSSRDSSEEKNDLDPKTGIVKRLLESPNPPVLLHCSAGVGRTGGFIVVDAVLDGLKRELRKRREAAARQRHAEESRTGTDSAEGMDVDDGDATGLAAPKPVHAVAQTGQNGILDVPQEASFSKDAPMDVDRTSPVQYLRSPLSTSVSSSAYLASQSMSPMSYPSLSPTPSHSMSPPAHTSMSPPTLPRSQAPLRAFPPHFDISAESAAIPLQTSLQKLNSPVEKGPLIFGGSLNADARVRTYSAPLSPSEARPDGPAHAHSSYESRQSNGIKTRSPLPEKLASPAEMMRSSPEIQLERKETPDDRIRDSFPSVPSLFTTQDSRRSSWEQTSLSSPLAGRSDLTFEGGGTVNLRDSHKRASLPENVREETTNGGVALGSASPNGSEFIKSKPFDYTRPRKLHREDSPPLLSSYKDPIRTVVEDIREQRMSLCQSLRQYVFVHRAIIEGALRLVDQEKELYGEDDRGRSDTERHTLRKGPEVGPPSLPGSGLGSPIPIASIPRVTTLQTSPTKHKRLASPTELIKEGKEGQLRLSKRPSMKKRQLSSDESAQFESDVPSKLRL